MTASVLYFTPKNELSATENIRAFVLLCRSSMVLRACEQWTSNNWECGYLKGHNKKNRANFVTLDAAAANAFTPSFPAPFLDFAKAIIVYMQDYAPVVSQAPRIGALRCIESALVDLNKDSRPSAVNEVVLDRAVELARTSVSPSVAYRIAGQIEAIARLMRESQFISLRHRWHHSMSKPAELGSRISQQALKRRREVLPSAALIKALGIIFFESKEPRDVMVGSTTALMLCAPERINEVLRLRRNCFVNGQNEFKGELGLRWSGSKGFADTTKWLPTVMGPIAREAVGNLLRASHSGHELAVWYTRNSGAIYLHHNVTHLRTKKTLSLAEISEILWGRKNIESARRFMSDKHVSALNGSKSVKEEFSFLDFEKAVLSMLPETFPCVPGDPNLKFEDSLAVMRTNEMHPRKATYLCMFVAIDYNAVTNSFGRAGRGLSIFDRFECFEDDGTSLYLKSHGLRHYLNMLSQTGGLNDSDIAIFSGRKDIRQNRFYDDRSSEEVQKPVTLALQAGMTSHLEVRRDRPTRVVKRGSFRGLFLGAAHTTDFGFCEHDFASEPCQLFRDCMNCSEQECIKGDDEKEMNLRSAKHETAILLKRAEASLSKEEYNANTWVLHQTRTLERIEALLSVFDDPKVSIGARIRLSADNIPLIKRDKAQIEINLSQNIS
ncbi:integrase [Variovorax sp. PvP013]|uniref:integrase n=1 Tax=Variovorax sp. PvP013 TaxID=3156435 RepID=UPI003D1AE098